MPDLEFSKDQLILWNSSATVLGRPPILFCYLSLHTAHPHRYLHELGDYDVSGRVLETAISAYDDKDSLLYADLRSISGSRFYDLNLLSDCRKAWDEVLRIRKAFLPEQDPASSYLDNPLAHD